MPNNGEGRDRIEKTKFCLYMYVPRKTLSDSNPAKLEQTSRERASRRHI